MPSPRSHSSLQGRPRARAIGALLLSSQTPVGAFSEEPGAAELEAAGCTITAKNCLNFPEYQRTQFRDDLGEEHLFAGSNEAACLKRAEDFHHWCGNGAQGGAQVAATYNPTRWSQLYHPGACERGWSLWDAFCYKYHWELRTWPDAEALCRQLDSHLASVHSQAENRFISVLAWGIKAWIGYTDVDKDTHYTWSDNTQDDFTNFAKNCTGREHEPDCRPEEVQQQWYSSKGTEVSPFVCKRNTLFPLALLRNTSGDELTSTPWSVLVPALAGSQIARVGAQVTDVSPQLKVQELAMSRAGETFRANAFPEPRLVMPKRSSF